MGEEQIFGCLLRPSFMRLSLFHDWKHNLEPFGHGGVVKLNVTNYYLDLD